MNLNQKQPLWVNLNRLAIVTGVLVLLKVFTYFFKEFLPVFAEVIGVAFSAILPFIFALIVAFLLEPLVVRLMRSIRIRRSFAVVLSLIISIAAISLFVFLFFARLYTELSDLAITIPNYGYIVDFLTKQVDTLQKIMNVSPQIQSTLYSATDSLAKTLQDWAKSGSLFLLSLLAALPRVFILLIVSLVGTLLMSANYPDVKRFLGNLVPKRMQSSVQAVVEDLGSAIVGYIRAQSMLVALTIFSTIVGLLLMGNRYAVTLGVLAGILDLVPIVGTGMLFVPWIIGLFIMGSFAEGVKILIMWGITVTVRQFLEPKILSKGIGIQPLPTLISLYIGLQLFGAIGIIAGPALVILYEALRKSGFFGRPKV